MRRKPVSRDEVRIFSDHRWNREMSITTAPIDAVRVDGYGGGDPIGGYGTRCCASLASRTGQLCYGVQAVPPMRAEILARRSDQRRVLLRPLRRPRSPGQVCCDQRRSASGGQERPQMRAVLKAALDDALLFGALPGRRASCWRLEPPPLCPSGGRWCVRPLRAHWPGRPTGELPIDSS